MLLRHSHTSPYVRKVMVLAHETGLVERITLETVDGWSEPEALTRDNPLSMVPTLVLDDGTTLFDSPVICEYLDGLHGGVPMFPSPGDPRWRALREQALGDGILDSAVLIFLENRRRPVELRWDWWLELKQRAITRTLDHLDAQAGQLRGRLDIGTIAVAVALGYLDLRGAVGEWRDGRPALGDWFDQFSQRPSMQATQPPA
jgi:glutathione S-transferase